MTTVAPVNQRASVPAVLSDTDHDADSVPAGHFSFCDGYDGTKEVSILFGCPCGCGELMSVAIKPYSRPSPLWSWDGNREWPTLTPSILIYQSDDAGNRIGEHWHGFLTAGEFKSC